MFGPTKEEDCVMAIKKAWSHSGKDHPGRRQVGKAVSGLFPADSMVVDILALDVSPSMLEEGFMSGRSKLDLLRQAGGLFLDAKRNVRPLDMVGVVPFNHEVRVVYDPTNVEQGYSALSKVIQGLSASAQGGTNISSALDACLDRLKHNGFLCTQSPFFCRVLLLSDGHSSYKERAVASAHALKERGVLVETLGLGKNPSSVDEALLQQIATQDSNGLVHYRYLGNPEELFLAFEEAAHAPVAGTLTWEG
jgi:von Willebrand factor type A domain